MSEIKSCISAILKEGPSTIACKSENADRKNRYIYHKCPVGEFKDVRYSKAQKILKFTFNALIQQLLPQLLQKSVQWYLIIWFSDRIHTAEKHHPTMFHTATVRPTRSGPNILYNTSLKTP